MTQPPAECEELRVHLERLRGLLDNLVVRGLRACGPDELAQLRSHAEHLDQAGAAHVASALSDLHARIERDDRSSAGALLTAQTSVRLLERLLTLRVVRGHFETALRLGKLQGDGDEDDDADEEG